MYITDRTYITRRYFDKNDGAEIYHSSMKAETFMAIDTDQNRVLLNPLSLTLTLQKGDTYNKAFNNGY